MGKYREITAELQHTFPNGWHTPAWDQLHMLSGHPLGCGPTAWGIVYGYWSAFQGKTRLFDGFDVASHYGSSPGRETKVAEAVGEISNDTDTNYGGEVINSRFGLTWPKNMPDGIKYAKRCGYNGAKCTRWRGTEFKKFRAIRDELKADRPVILLIKSDGRGIPNHYVVVEKAILKQKKVLGKWRDRDVHYVVNFGHGSEGRSGRKDIWVRETGRNDHKLYTAASAFLIRL